MTGMQWLIWTLAAAGKFFEGLVVFMTGVALPLISTEFGLGQGRARGDQRGEPVRHSGRAIGLGGLSDFFGRKRMFVVGVALGCDYPTAHVIISESIPSARSCALSASLSGRSMSFFPRTTRRCGSPEPSPEA